MKLSLAEIIATAQKTKGDDAKIEWLQKNTSLPLRTVLKMMYDKDQVKFLIPSEAPPWKKNNLDDIEGKLFLETRRLNIFIKNGGYDNLNQAKREQLFIQLLQDIDDDDAELLCKMIIQKPLQGLTKKVVMSAFPADYQIVDK